MSHDAPSQRKSLAPLEAGGGRGKVLFLDAFSGASGDMLLGALLHLGVPEEAIFAPLKALPLERFEASVSDTSRNGIAALKVDIVPKEPSPQRTYRDIQGLLQDAPLPASPKTKALEAFRRLAAAESQVHQMPLDEVHFHEVGALDSIVDIVACCLGFAYLGAEVMVRPLPLGNGFVRAAHGTLPVPTPATLLCWEGKPTESLPADGPTVGELVTPTGACLLASHVQSVVAWPPLAVERVGYGAGTREVPGRPNLLRAVLGTGAAEVDQSHAFANVCVIEANLDDMTGEFAGRATEQLLAAGALDAWCTPITGKKGRPGWIVSALSAPADKQKLASVLLRETPSFGVRFREMERIERPRRWLTVATAFGSVDVKVADGDAIEATVAPEYDSCRRAAEAHQASLRQVYQAALAAALEHIERRD